MGQLLLTLNDNEEEWLEEVTPEEASRQSLIRALMFEASQNGELLEVVQEGARADAKIPPKEQRMPGKKAGYGEEDYRAAIEKTGSMLGAAQELGVSRSTVREQCIRHDIHVPSIGGVPE